MATKITDEILDYIGILAKLELEEDEKSKAKEDMEKMLAYVEQLNQLDTTGVKPMTHVFPMNNKFREDIVTNDDGSELTLQNAPAVKNGSFKVPRTVE